MDDHVTGGRGKQQTRQRASKLLEVKASCLIGDGRLPPVSSHLSMSRHPSPGPSHSVPQIFPQAASAPSRRSRPSHSIGIAAGAEDVKYQGKYKDLKRKVKEIEGVGRALLF